MPRTAPYSPHTPSRVRLEDGTERDVPARMTLEEFSAFPWPENEAWELIWDVPVLAPRPQWIHQSLMLPLSWFLQDRLPEEPAHLVLPQVDVTLPAARSWVVPDVAVFLESQIDENTRPIKISPLLAVEILSPSTASIDVGPKRDAYAKAGTPEYWTANPKTGSLAVYVKGDDGGYRQVSADSEGFVESPFLGVSFRVVLHGKRYQILTR